LLQHVGWPQCSFRLCCIIQHDGQSQHSLWYALYCNTTGEGANTALWCYALYDNTIGFGNTAGRIALEGTQVAIATQLRVMLHYILTTNWITIQHRV
jgi:hypothetical protein